MLDQYVNLNNVIENKLFLFSTGDEGKEYFANYNSQYDRIKSIINVLNILELGLYIII